MYYQKVGIDKVPRSFIYLCCHLVKRVLVFCLFVFVLKGELDDAMAELEENRRKLTNLQMQKDIASGMHFPSSGAANGHLSPEKSAERTINLHDLKNSIEETKVYMLSYSLSCFLSLLINHSFWDSSNKQLRCLLQAVMPSIKWRKKKTLSCLNN